MTDFLPRWGDGHIPEDPRARYRSALDSYRAAEFDTYRTRITGAEFATLSKDEIAGLEIVTDIDGREYVTERSPTPGEWADASEAVTRRYLNSYVVRNTLHPYADWEREMSSLRAGLSV
jgi:hypothetical protein